MGINRTAGRKSNVAQRLAYLAEQLEAKKKPYYVFQPDAKTPSQGWWWIPQGLTSPVYLGHNRVTAENALNALVNGHYK